MAEIALHGLEVIMVKLFVQIHSRIHQLNIKQYSQMENANNIYIKNMGVS